MPVTLQGGPHQGKTVTSPKGTDYDVLIAYDELAVWGREPDLRRAKKSDFPQSVYRWDGDSLEYEDTYGGI